MWFFLCAALVLLDQITKWLSVEKLSIINSYPIINNVLHLTYVENTGAAFGMLKGRFGFFTIMTIIATVSILVYYFKYTTKQQKLLRLSLILILSGAMGNFIDRIFRGFVVDMIDFRLINFWVFNVADICVCIGVGLLCFYILFLDKKNAV